MPAIFKKYTFWINAIVFTLFIGFMALRIAVDVNAQSFKELKPLYRIYIDGEFIGAIPDYKELDALIEKESADLKEKYNIDTIYKPNNVNYDKSYTSMGQQITLEQALNIVKQRTVFTIEGYDVTIDKKKHFFVMSKEELEKALNKFVLSYVDEKSYENLLSGNKADLTKLGEHYEDVYIDNKITVSKQLVPIENTLITSDEISQYLMYQKLDKLKTYTVQKGDDIYSIADKFKLYYGELLIANPGLKENSILAPGEDVNIELINPMIQVIVEKYDVRKQEVPYKTEYKKSDQILAGYDKVVQYGHKGEAKVSYKIRVVNGEEQDVTTKSYEVTTQPVNQVIAQGTKVIPNVGNLHDWRWPTLSSARLTSTFGWRWGRLHSGIDLAGTGMGSPIYAANNGTVVAVGYNSTEGHYIKINHNNGYVTVYKHLKSGTIRVRVGQTVTGGQRIAGMGNSGFVVGATGIHLHFEVIRNGSFINPLNVY